MLLILLELSSVNIFPNFQKNILLSSREWPFTTFLDNFTSLLRFSFKEVVFHDLFAPFENGAFIITETTATLESMIIFVTLLNVSLLILIERPKPSRFHVFLSGLNCQLHSFDSIVTDDVRAFIIPSSLQRSISRNA